MFSSNSYLARKTFGLRKELNKQRTEFSVWLHNVSISIQDYWEVRRPGFVPVAQFLIVMTLVAALLLAGLVIGRLESEGALGAVQQLKDDLLPVQKQLLDRIAVLEAEKQPSPNSIVPITLSAGTFDSSKELHLGLVNIFIGINIVNSQPTSDLVLTSTEPEPTEIAVVMTDTPEPELQTTSAAETEESTLTLTPTEQPTEEAVLVYTPTPEETAEATSTVTPTVTSSFVTPTPAPATATPNATLTKFCPAQPTQNLEPKALDSAEYGEWQVFECWAFAQGITQSRYVVFSQYNGNESWSKPIYHTLTKASKFERIMFFSGLKKPRNEHFHAMAIFLFERDNGGVNAIMLDLNQFYVVRQVYLDRFEYRYSKADQNDKSLFAHEDGLTISRGSVTYTVSPETYGWTIVSK